MRDDRNKQKKPAAGTIAVIVIGLVMLAPELLAVVVVIAVLAAVFGSPFLLVYLAKKKSGTDRRPKRERAFPVDECPKPICFHKDRGEHHVKRGREQDPWDRPDIDIRKYQRRE